MKLHYSLHQIVNCTVSTNVQTYQNKWRFNQLFVFDVWCDDLAEKRKNRPIDNNFLSTVDGSVQFNMKNDFKILGVWKISWLYRTLVMFVCALLKPRFITMLQSCWSFWYHYAKPNLSPLVGRSVTHRCNFPRPSYLHNRCHHRRCIPDGCISCSYIETRCYHNLGKWELAKLVIPKATGHYI